MNETWTTDTRVEQLEDGRWLASMPSFPGVWADGDTIQDAVNALPSVLREWLKL